MDTIVFSLALAALAPSSAAADQAPPSPARAAVAQRSPGGAVASATITVRILSNPARIGAGAPPARDMVPRLASIAATDGSPVDALIYEYE